MCVQSRSSIYMTVICNLINTISEHHKEKFKDVSINLKDFCVIMSRLRLINDESDSFNMHIVNF